MTPRPVARRGVGNLTDGGKAEIVYILNSRMGEQSRLRYNPHFDTSHLPVGWHRPSGLFWFLSQYKQQYNYQYEYNGFHVESFRLDYIIASVYGGYKV